MRLRLTLRESVALAGVAFALGQLMAAQEAPKSPDSCVGLHAGISAQLTKLTQGYAEPSVMVTFLLLNDSETTRGAAPESWRLVIDGKELEESHFLFSNGPKPIGGYGTLDSGASFNFGMALPIAKYFPEQREYRISWKGRYFQSPTVTVRIPS
jgi:hypothetical protein